MQVGLLGLSPPKQKRNVNKSYNQCKAVWGGRAAGRWHFEGLNTNRKQIKQDCKWESKCKWKRMLSEVAAVYAMVPLAASRH